MKLYAGNWHGYGQCHQEIPVTLSNLTNWQEALIEMLNEEGIEMHAWHENEPIIASLSLDETQYETWLLTLLYQEQKKVMPHTNLSLETDRLYQKVESGLVKSNLSMLWEPQAYLPIDCALIFDYIDPDEEAMCFGSLSTYFKYLKQLPNHDETIRTLLEFIRNAVDQHQILFIEYDEV